MADLSVFDLTGHKALVTGAGKGIGKGIALSLAQAGADVAVCARTLPDVEKVAQGLTRFGVRALPLQCDVRVPEQVEAAMQQTVDRLGGLDILVNNAGGSFRAQFMDLSLGGWDAVVKENLDTAFICCKAAGKIMLKAKRGSIINISSAAAFYGSLSNTVSYGAAKAGVNNLTLALSVIWGPYNVRVNAIAPGMIETEGAKAIKRTPEEWAERMKSVPVGRLGRPDEIGSVCVFLASDASSYVTGVTIPVTGGQVPAIPPGLLKKPG